MRPGTDKETEFCDKGTNESVLKKIKELSRFKKKRTRDKRRIRLSRVGSQNRIYSGKKFLRHSGVRLNDKGCCKT